jgi:cytochrome c-type biogenesis protein CcmH/NrfG
MAAVPQTPGAGEVMSETMLTWGAVLLLTLGLGALVLRGSLNQRSRVVIVTAVLALGLAGYALDGKPGLAASPAPRMTADRASTSAFEASRKALLANAGDVGAWLTFSDALVREGRSEDAIDGLQAAIKTMPDNADLWVGLGQAMTMHAGGFVTPAARLAFDRASVLDPENPAPQYFLGLAWLQAGDVKTALAAWEALRAKSPADAPWVPDLDQKIAAAKMMMAMEMAGGPAAKQPID